MADIDKVIRGWERCQICDMSVLSDEKGKEAYLACEYTMGFYCRRDRLIYDTLEVLRKCKENDKRTAGSP